MEVESSSIIGGKLRRFDALGDCGDGGRGKM